MFDRSDIRKALLIADRAYESYNVLAHIQAKGWQAMFCGCLFAAIKTALNQIYSCGN